MYTCSLVDPCFPLEVSLLNYMRIFEAAKSLTIIGFVTAKSDL